MSASVYAEILSGGSRRVAESPVPRIIPPDCGELGLQALLYGGQLGVEWTTECGERVVVERFGEWNREAGPDFRGAVLHFSERGRVVGDIELDLHSRDWEGHGHSTNPAFADVALHIFYHREARRSFARDIGHRAVPQVCLATGGEPVRSTGNTGAPAFSGWEPGKVLPLLDAAGAYRLGLKRERYARVAALLGEDEALFQHLARTMGYKHNAIPFLLVAQRTTWQRARGGDGEALLFGLAGFLRAPSKGGRDADRASYERSLWERWWKHLAAEERLVLPAGMWCFAGVRPTNHPHRRMGALAALARNMRALAGAIKSADPDRFAETAGRIECPFWSTHYSLSSKAGIPHALVGADRLEDLLINVFLAALPAASAMGGGHLEALLRHRAPGRLGGSARSFFGPAWRTPMNLLQEQGLLQLREDFGSVPDPALFRQDLRERFCPDSTPHPDRLV